MIIDAVVYLLAFTLLSVLLLAIGGVWFMIVALSTDAFCKAFGKPRPQWLQRFD